MLKLFQKSDYEILKEVGTSIVKRRKMRGLSQVAMAEIVGVNVSTIKAIEKGDGCHLKIFIKILKYLDLDEKFLKALYMEDFESPKISFNNENKKGNNNSI